MMTTNKVHQISGMKKADGKLMYSPSSKVFGRKPLKGRKGLKTNEHAQ